MGYSCTVRASHAVDILGRHCVKQTGSQNVWHHRNQRYFWERGRENHDGAITGTVHRFTAENMAVRVGSFRIEPDGRVARFPAWPFTWKDYRKRFAELRAHLFGSALFVTIPDSPETREYDLILPSIQKDIQLNIYA